MAKISTNISDLFKYLQYLLHCSEDKKISKDKNLMIQLECLSNLYTLYFDNVLLANKISDKDPALDEFGKLQEEVKFMQCLGLIKEIESAKIKSIKNDKKSKDDSKNKAIGILEKFLAMFKKVIDEEILSNGTIENKQFITKRQKTSELLSYFASTINTQEIKELANALKSRELNVDYSFSQQVIDIEINIRNLKGKDIEELSKEQEKACTLITIILNMLTHKCAE